MFTCQRSPSMFTQLVVLGMFSLLTKMEISQVLCDKANVVKPHCLGSSAEPFSDIKFACAKTICTSGVSIGAGTACGCCRSVPCPDLSPDASSRRVAATAKCDDGVCMGREEWNRPSQYS